MDFHYLSHRIHGAGIYANIWGILMGSMLPYIAYMDPMGMNITMFIVSHVAKLPLGRVSPRAGHRKRRW